MTGRYLVFDIGTTGAKAALIEGKQIVRSEIATYPTHQGDDGVMEQSATDWADAVREAAAKLGALDDLDGVIFTGQMQDVILLDEKGIPVRPAILYSDTRAHNEAAEINAVLTETTLHQVTGNGQDAGSLLAKLRWIAKHEPESLARANHLVFGAADYMVARLCGRFISDSTTASTTGLLDIHSRQIIDKALLETAGLGDCVALMPEVISGGSQVGIIIEEAAAQWGLPVGAPVYLAPGDAGSATIGAGSGEVGAAYAYIGTSGWVGFTATSPANPAQGVITLAHPHPDYFIQVAPLMSAGGNLEWIGKLFDQDDTDDLISAALQRNPTRLMYLPYLNGERAPFSDPFARGAFVGLTGQITQSDMVRAVLEGVVYAYRHVLDALAPDAVDTLTLIGGGTRSSAWCQLFADVIGLPVQIAADAENGGLRGALQAVAVQRQTAQTYALDDLPIAQQLPPDAKSRPLYDAKYAIFRQLYPDLKDAFYTLGQLEINLT